MKRYRYLVSRRAVILESYYIEADSEEEAYEILGGDGPDYSDPYDTDWVDWYDSNWEIEDEEERDPLLLMVANHTPNKEEELVCN
jgi:hypothetical protein